MAKINVPIPKGLKTFFWGFIFVTFSLILVTIVARWLIKDEPRPNEQAAPATIPAVIDTTADSSQVAKKTPSIGDTLPSTQITPREDTVQVPLKEPQALPAKKRVYKVDSVTEGNWGVDFGVCEGYGAALLLAEQVRKGPGQASALIVVLNDSLHVTTGNGRKSRAQTNFEQLRDRGWKNVQVRQYLNVKETWKE